MQSFVFLKLPLSSKYQANKLFWVQTACIQPEIHKHNWVFEHVKDWELKAADLSYQLCVCLVISEQKTPKFTADYSAADLDN